MRSTLRVRHYWKVDTMKLYGRNAIMSIALVLSSITLNEAASYRHFQLPQQSDIPVTIEKNSRKTVKNFFLNGPTPNPGDSDSNDFTSIIKKFQRNKLHLKASTSTPMPAELVTRSIDAKKNITSPPPSAPPSSVYKVEEKSPRMSSPPPINGDETSIKPQPESPSLEELIMTQIKKLLNQMNSFNPVTSTTTTATTTINPPPKRRNSTKTRTTTTTSTNNDREYDREENEYDEEEEEEYKYKESEKKRPMSSWDRDFDRRRENALGRLKPYVSQLSASSKKRLGEGDAVNGKTNKSADTKNTNSKMEKNENNDAIAFPEEENDNTVDERTNKVRENSNEVSRESTHHDDTLKGTDETLNRLREKIRKAMKGEEIDESNENDKKINDGDSNNDDDLFYPENVDSSCPVNEEYQECGSICEPSCNDPKPSICFKVSDFMKFSRPKITLTDLIVTSLFLVTDVLHRLPL